MGCPMFEKKLILKNPTEYPFQSLYRPWSWTLSSLSNVAIFAILLLLVYALIKRRLRRRKETSFTYRQVQCKATQAEGRTSALVTGGCGNLGQHLLQCLVDSDQYQVHSLDLFIPDEDKMVPGVASYIKADITNPGDLSLAFESTRPDVVFHTAGLIPSVRWSNGDLYRVNSDGTRCVVDACQRTGVKRLVYTSTCDVLMSKDKEQVLERADESHPYPKKPLNAYCGSKMEGEKAVLKANDSQLATCVLRSSIIAGPQSAMFQALLTNQGAYIGNGMNKQCLIEIGACAEAHLLADRALEENPSLAAGQVYHLVGDEYRFRDFVNYSLDDSGYTVWGYPERRSIPKWIASTVAFLNMLAYTLTGYCPLDAGFDCSAVEFATRSYTFSGEKAKRDLGFPADDHPSWQEVVLGVLDDYEKSKKTK